MDKKQVASKMGKKLSQKEVSAARNSVRQLTKLGSPKATVLKNLQNRFPKLQKNWQAKRVARTETTRINAMGEVAKARREGAKKINISGHADACPDCRANWGERDASHQAPPYHPNCRCGVSH